MENFNETKNYIHNELGISKEFIRNIILDEINKQINLIVKNTFNDFDVYYLINESIDNCIKSSLSEKYFVDKIKERVCKKFNI